MRSWGWVSLVMLQLLATGCQGDHRLTLKGSIGSRTSNKRASSPGDIVKVMVYRHFGIAELAGVAADGTFAVGVARDGPCGLVFLDAADAAVGYLSLAQGIEALPLTLLDEGIAELDLDTIDLVDGVGTPAHNPIESGGELELAADELAAYRLQSALFSTIVRNLDMNADGTIDVLSDRPYWMSFGATFDGGALATSDPDGSSPPPTLDFLGFSFSDNHATVANPPAVFTAPAGERFPHPQHGKAWVGHEDGREVPTYMWNLMESSLTTLVPGEYSIVYDTDAKRVAFEMETVLASDRYIVATDVWYSRPAAQRTTLHWKWRMLDGTPVDASRLLWGVVLQVNRRDGASALFYNPASSDLERTLDLDAATIASVSLSGRDLFDNYHATNLAWP